VTGAARKVVLVTGASAGIGRATASLLGEHGWDVVAASRRGTAPQGAQALVMDVDDDGSVEQGVAGVLDRYGRMDAVVSCAGWGLGGAFETTPLDEARAQMETNFWGTVRVARAALPAMRSQGGGRLVWMSSIGGVLGLPFQGYYSASKFALEGLAEAMAHELAPLGVDVTLIEPGNVRTDFTERRRVLRDGGVYAKAMERAITVMERDEQNGVDALKVAQVVSRVLGSRRPPRRVSVGRASERVGIVGKRVMPYRLFEASARGSLGVSRKPLV
jgi:NAD(P)-dependent dehydrogenase (short-subunit alcohol dehydrogenase family)